MPIRPYDVPGPLDTPPPVSRLPSRIPDTRHLGPEYLTPGTCSRRRLDHSRIRRTPCPYLRIPKGLTPEEIVREYPPLTIEDVRAAIAYAAELAREEELMPPR